MKSNQQQLLPLKHAGSKHQCNLNNLSVFSNTLSNVALKLLIKVGYVQKERLLSLRAHLHPIKANVNVRFQVMYTKLDRMKEMGCARAALASKQCVVLINRPTMQLLLK